MWNGCWAICAANRRCMWSPNRIPPAGPSSPATPTRWSFPSGWRSLTPTRSITVSAVTVLNSLAAMAPSPHRQRCSTPVCPGAWAAVWTLVPPCKCRSNSAMAIPGKSFCVWGQRLPVTPPPSWCSVIGAAWWPPRNCIKYGNTGAHCSGRFVLKRARLRSTSWSTAG